VHRPIDDALAQRLFAKSPEARFVLLRTVWPRAVGQELARRTEAIRLDGDTLCVRVQDGRWMKALHGMRRTILSQLAASAGCLAPKRLGFLEGHATSAPPPEPHVASESPSPPSASAALVAAAGAIPDPALRTLFLEAALRYLSRASSSPTSVDAASADATPS
jgi:hypothetical protein